ncbi:MAG TPA: elongation factor G [Terriglobales bacterium]|nr:elongation factor G [Terriglobales bacterium]
MKVYDTAHLRNLAVAGHGGGGKTTLVAAALYTAGATPAQGRIETGTTPTDFDEQEILRGSSIASAVGFAEWPGPDRALCKLNFVDTPGQTLFQHEAAAVLDVVDAVVLVVDAASGVQVQTVRAWEAAAARGLPVVVVIGRADHEHADVPAVLGAVRERWGRGVCAVQAPIGAQRGFQGVIDVVGMAARLYPSEGNGKARIVAIDDAYAEAAKAGHEALVELVAEGDDALMEEFFDKGTIPIEHLQAGLRAALLGRRLFPVLITAGAANLGTDALLDFLAAYAPAPGARGPSQGAAPGAAPGASPLTRLVTATEPLSLFVFKTLADPFAGRLSLFRVCSGHVKSDATVLNFTRQSTERLAHLSLPQGKLLVPVAELHAGDLGVVAKLKDTLTGDTLGDKAAAIVYPAAPRPEAAIQFALEAKSRGDEDKVALALHKMLEEDVALHFDREASTGEFLLGGSGQQHVEIAVAKLKQRYHVEVKLRAPRVAYRETILGRADVQGRYKKQTGGHGQFGDCKIRMEPLERGAGFEFVNEIFGGSIPRNFIPAVEKGIQESAQRGYLAGYPVVDFRVVLYDGAYHDVDSSELAFKVAGSLAFKKAMEQARPVLIEPIMEVAVESPAEFTGDLIGDLNARRGRIEGLVPRSGAADLAPRSGAGGTATEAAPRPSSELIRAQVPLAEMLSYQSDLTAKTQGRGSFHMRFSHYDLVPAAQADKIVAKARAEHGHATEDD